MRSASSFQSLALRFGPYIEELQQFLASCNVAFGSPENIIPFTERLSAPGYFRDGICAMIRAIIYREHEAVSHLELLELMLVGVGGTEVDEDSAELESSKRKLSRVIGQAMTSLWTMPHAGTSMRMVPDERMDEDPAPVPELPPSAAALGTHSSEVARSPFARAEPPGMVPLQSRVWTVAAGLAAVDAREDNRLEPVHLTAAANPNPLASHGAAPAIPGTAASSTAPEPASEPIVWAMPPRLIWIGAAFALLLAPAINVALGHHPKHLAAPAVRTPNTHKPAPTTPGPSTFNTNLQPLSAAKVPDQLPPLSTAADANDPAAELPREHHRHASRTRAASASPLKPLGPQTQSAGPAAFTANIPPRQTDMPGRDRNWSSTAAQTGDIPTPQP